MKEIYLPNLNILLSVGDHIDIHYSNTSYYGRDITIKEIIRCTNTCSKEHCTTRVFLVDEGKGGHPCLNKNIRKIVFKEKTLRKNIINKVMEI